MAEEKYTFHVDGMHCASCEYLIESKLKGVQEVTSVKADLGSKTVTIEGDFSESPSVLTDRLTSVVVSDGYRISEERVQSTPNYREFIVAIPTACAFVLAFVLLQRAGFVNLVTGSEVTYGTAFLVGLIASVSTCLAVVGGLVLSVSANAAKGGGRWRSQAMFHAGRLGGFFLLGGVIGLVGGVFQLGYIGTAVLSILVALVMLVLGVNLLDVFPGLKKLQPRMPKLLGKRVEGIGASSHMIAPLFAGVATFFLPCGFTQSMQIYTLTTNSYLEGGLTMLFFALGTFPMLALLSFGVLEISHRSWKGTFFKTTGLVVIMLGLFNLWNGLVSFGIVPPLFSI